MVYAVGLVHKKETNIIEAILVNISGENEETMVGVLKHTKQDIPEKIVEKLNQLDVSKKIDSFLLGFLNIEIGKILADAAYKVVEKADMNIEDITFISSEGINIQNKKNKEDLSYLNIGETAVIAEKTGSHVVSDFSINDLVVKGNGKNLTVYPYYILYRHQSRTRILYDGDQSIIIPANSKPENIILSAHSFSSTFIDEIYHFFFKDIDSSEQGKVNHILLEKWERIFNDSFASTSEFTKEEIYKYFIEDIVNQFKLESKDWLATATAFNAYLMKKDIEKYITNEVDFIVKEENAYQQSFIASCQKLFPKASFLSHNDLGYPIFIKEALAMVILGNQTLHHQPGNIPLITGAEKEVLLGKITFGHIHHHEE